MAEQAIDPVSTAVEKALQHKTGRTDLEVTQPYQDILNTRQGNAYTNGAPSNTAAGGQRPAIDAEALRQSEAYKIAIEKVSTAQKQAYENSKDRGNILKKHGEMDARDQLNGAYGKLLKHMHDHPDHATHDATLLQAFQMAANGAAKEKNLSEDGHDRMLANMLNAHINNVNQQTAIDNAVEYEVEHHPHEPQL